MPTLLKEVIFKRSSDQVGKPGVGQVNLVIWNDMVNPPSTTELGPTVMENELILPAGLWNLRFQATIEAEGAYAVCATMQLVNLDTDSQVVAVSGSGENATGHIKSDFDFSVVLPSAKYALIFRIAHRGQGTDERDARVGDYRLIANVLHPATATAIKIEQSWSNWQVVRVNESPDGRNRDYNFPLSTTDFPASHWMLTDVVNSENTDFYLPSLVHMPMPGKEQGRLLLLLSRTSGDDHRPVQMTSDDLGETWTSMRPIPGTNFGSRHTYGLSYLGGGRLLFETAGGELFASSDYGEKWESISNVPQGSPETVFLHDSDEQKVLHTSYSFMSGYGRSEPYGILRRSDDGGKTWTDSGPVLEWRSASAICLLRCSERHLIAACRTEKPGEFDFGGDSYDGIGISLSRDNGQRWTPITQLFSYGRNYHRLCQIGDRVILTYCVRLGGYPRDQDGLPVYGIEAITCDIRRFVERDEAPLWDLRNRFIISRWTGSIKSMNSRLYLQGPEGVSTVPLPDKRTMLTVYSTGYRCIPKDEQPPPPPRRRDIGLVKWPLRLCCD